MPPSTPTFAALVLSLERRDRVARASAGMAVPSFCSALEELVASCIRDNPVAVLTELHDAQGHSSCLAIQALANAGLHLPVLIYISLSAEDVHWLPEWCSVGFDGVVVVGLDDVASRFGPLLAASQQQTLGGRIRRETEGRVPLGVRSFFVTCADLAHRARSVAELVLASDIPYRTLADRLRRAGLPSGERI